MTSLATITGLVLAGGRSVRMGGNDKGLASLWGQPMIAHVLARLEPQVDDIMISSNRNLEIYREFGHPVITDGDDAFNGPLAGLFASFNVSRADYILIVPCDSPCLPGDLAARLFAALERKDVKAAVASDGVHEHYTTALIARQLVSDLAEYLASGNRRVGQWLAQNKAASVDFASSAESFVNLNTPGALAALEAVGRCPLEAG